MADKFKTVPILVWDRWSDKLSIGLLIVVMITFFGCLVFWSTFNIPVAREETSCRLVSWGYWQPDSKVTPASMVAKCTLPDGKLIYLTEAIGWPPPDIGSEIKVEIVHYRLTGAAYYAK